MKTLLLVLCLPISVFAQLAKASDGTIKRFENFKSSFVDSRNVDVWLPADYNSNAKYDVLYMHDGQMLFDSSSNWNHQEWQVDETAGKLIREKKIKKLIIVGIWNNGKYRRSEYFPQNPLMHLPNEIKDTLITNYLLGKAQADNYLKFITKELKPFIDSAFSTNTSQAHTFIAGSSMGGLISLYAICEYPQIFGGAACLSTNWPGIVWKCERIAPYFVSYLKNALPSPVGHKIYFDYGSLGLDSLYKPHQLKVDEVMHSKGFNSTNWITKEFPGENHSEHAWCKRMYMPLEFLLNNQ